MKPFNSLLATLRQQEDSLLYFLTSKVGCRDTAADLFQQLAEKLLRKEQPSDKPVDNETAYLYRAARNEVISHFRSEQSRARYEQDYMETSASNDSYNVEEAALARQKVQQLNTTLKQLPPLTQEIFWRYRIDGQRQKDIAEALDVSLSTVEKHLANASSTMRQSLRQTDTRPANR